MTLIVNHITDRINYMFLVLVNERKGFLGIALLILTTYGRAIFK